ncbi:hypothetical protein LZC95_47550 [Pendulispora brunnea]|uniref:NADH dehydrogenase subunit 6 n=1 Tax=Pendulispora brunnea TaxID=2905690 RepID=A0ABZ2K5X1_9BACT
MHLYDVLAVVLLVLGAVAFVLGGTALARAEDLTALYWMVAGLTTMRASVQIARSGVRG